MMRKQGDLQKQIDFYNSNNKTTHFQSNDISNIKLTEMSANYLKEIKKLKKQIAELQLKQINLSHVSSNVSHMLNS